MQQDGVVGIHEPGEFARHAERVDRRLVRIDVRRRHFIPARPQPGDLVEPRLHRREARVRKQPSRGIDELPQHQLGVAQDRNVGELFLVQFGGIDVDLDVPGAVRRGRRASRAA